MMILVIVLLILLLKLNRYRKNNISQEPKTNDDYYGTGIPVYIDDDNDELYPENIYAVVYRYKGEVELFDIYESLYYFKTFIEDISREDLSTEEKIQEFFQENQKYIEARTNTNNDIEAFKAILEEAKKVNLAEETFQKAMIDIDSIEENIEGITCKLSLRYTNTILNFQFSILNDVLKNTYIYKVY